MPKPKHPLRLIRAATPHATQAAFAAFLGVPVAVVRAVESGTARLTPRLAGRIRELTGADDRELLRGEDGAARTVSGKRFTLAAFEAWQGSPQQAAEQERRQAARLQATQAWNCYAAAAIPRWSPEASWSEADRLAVEDWMLPWQTCEFSSAAASSWPKLPDALRQRTGWAPDLPVSRQCRLTLAVQSVPSWDPEGVPPGLAAANAELFPPCCFTIAAGSGGSRAAAAFWRAICREHGIHQESGKPERDAPSGNWRGFFRDRGDRCEPHAVFAGLDPDDTSALPVGLFAPGSMLAGPAGDDLAEGAIRFLEAHSRDAGSPSGILLFLSLEGGTASALGSRLLARLRELFPAAPILAIGVLPLPGVSQVVTAPWHLALALRAIRRHAAAALLFPNESLLHAAARDWEIPAPGYADANALIAECLGSLTAPMRFGGNDHPPVDLAALLACFPVEPGHIPLLTGRSWPLAALADRRARTLSLPRMTERLLKAAVRAGVDETHGLAAFLRVRLEPGSPLITDDQPPALRLTGRIGTGLHESASVVGAFPDLTRTLRRLARQASEVWTAENAPLLCEELGVSPEELKAAIAEMKSA